MSNSRRGPRGRMAVRVPVVEHDHVGGGGDFAGALAGTAEKAERETAAPCLAENPDRIAGIADGVLQSEGGGVGGEFQDWGKHDAGRAGTVPRGRREAPAAGGAAGEQAELLPRYLDRVSPHDKGALVERSWRGTLKGGEKQEQGAQAAPPSSRAPWPRTRAATRS